MSRYTILSDAEITGALAGLPGWQMVENQLVAEFTFHGFREAIGFVLQIAFVAEELDHHPEILNAYNRVSLRLCTHDAGNKITDVDIKVARRITALYNALHDR